MNALSSKLEGGRVDTPKAAVGRDGHLVAKEAGDPPGPEQPMRIAVVDDEQEMRFAIKCLIETVMPGWEVESYASGEEALLRIPNSTVDVVLMDIDMNGMSGLECTRRLKERKPDLPVIMLSAFYRSGEVIHAKMVGANGFLVKPIEDAVQLVQTVKAALSKLRVFCAETEEELVKQSAVQSGSDMLSPFAEGFSIRKLISRFGIAEETRTGHRNEATADDRGSGHGVHRERRWLVALVHDDPGVRLFVTRTLLSSTVECDIETFPGAREVLRRFPTSAPTGVLVQLRAHDELLACINHLRTSLPLAPIIVMSPNRQREAIFSCLAARASGYLVLPVARSELVRALLAGVAGLTVFCPESERLVGDYTVHATWTAGGGVAPGAKLSPCEASVLACLDKGFSEKEIAEVLRVAPRTVSGFKARLYEKLGAHGRKEAVRKGQRLLTERLT